MTTRLGCGSEKWIFYDYNVSAPKWWAVGHTRALLLAASSSRLVVVLRQESIHYIQPRLLLGSPPPTKRKDICAECIYERLVIYTIFFSNNLCNAAALLSVGRRVCCKFSSFSSLLLLHHSAVHIIYNDFWDVFLFFLSFLLLSCSFLLRHYIVVFFQQFFLHRSSSPLSSPQPPLTIFLTLETLMTARELSCCVFTLNFRFVFHCCGLSRWWFLVFQLVQSSIQQQRRRQLCSLLFFWGWRCCMLYNLWHFMHNYAHSVSTENILEFQELTIRSWISFIFIFVYFRWRVAPSANSYVIYDRRISFTAFNDDSIIRRPHTQALRFIQLFTVYYRFCSFSVRYPASRKSVN